MLETIIAIFTIKPLFMWIVYVLAFWGLLDLYCYLRFKRKGAGKIDQTASFHHWAALKWALASQTDLIAEKLPFVKKDWTEVISLREDDGKIS